MIKLVWKTGPIAALAAFFLSAGCFESLPLTEKTVSAAEYEKLTNIMYLSLGALNKQKDSEVSSVYDSMFALRGAWNSFTGNGATSNQITRYPTYAGQAILDDSTTFSGCSVLISFNNAAGTFISQNPENNGPCFGTTNKGLYHKNVFFSNAQGTWVCQVAFNKATEAEAQATADTTDKSSPGTGGCSGFSWSRIERR